MVRAGVVGYPVSHSLSPKLHGFWLKKYGINGEYNAYEVQPEKLGEFIKSMPEKNIHGVNLTIPHKELVLPMLDELDRLARSVGAVNTVVAKDGKLHGTNTDVYGFAENIRPHMTGHKKALVLGAGGAAKAVCVALQQLGYLHITVCNRTRQRAAELSYELPGNVGVADWEHRNAALQHLDLLVNTTSLGMKNNPPLEIDLSHLPKSALVTDIVYSPLITPLLAGAREHGNPTVDGLGMLIHQAVPAFEAWFGVRPDVTDEVRQHILNA